MSTVKSEREAVAQIYRMGNGIGSLVYTDHGAKSDLPHGTKLYLRAERAGVPDGWALKPRKATGDMILAGIHANLSDPGPDVFGRIWTAMFTTAPSQPEDAESGA